MPVQLCAETSNPSRYIEDDAWAIEQKLDGHRVEVTIQDGVVTPRNRHGDVKSGWPRELRKAFESLPGNWDFDGELVGYTYWVFDLLALPGVGDITHLSWSERRKMLDTLFSTAPNLPRCLRSTTFETDRDRKQALYDQCFAGNVEGVVFKKQDSPYSRYVSGARNANWQKFKFVKTVDCVVTELDRKGKQESIGLGLYDNNGICQPAGGCRLLPKFKGKVALDSVVEVRYLYSADGTKVIQPVLLAIRDDKRPEECTQSQLIVTNKSVLELENNHSC